MSPALFNLYMADMPEPDKEKGQGLVVYADDVNMTSTHEKVKIAERNAQIYLNKIVDWIKENKLLLADKTQVTLFTPDPAEYNKNLNIKLEGQRIKTTKNPKILGLTFDPKLTFSEHIKNVENASKGNLRLIKALSGTTWGQQQETLTNTYKQYNRPAIEYACTSWSPIISKTNEDKLQRIQNAALRCATGHTKDTNVIHLHTETKVLPLNQHMKMIASQFREGTRDPAHPLNQAANAPSPERRQKMTALHKDSVTMVHGCHREGEEIKNIERNKRKLHTIFVEEHLESIPENTLIGMRPPEVRKEERTLPRGTRRTLAQLRAQKCPMLKSYLHDIGANDTPNCPLCERTEHTCAHLFSCPSVPTELAPIDLWCQPVRAAELINDWDRRLAAEEEAQGAAVRQ